MKHYFAIFALTQAVLGCSYPAAETTTATTSSPAETSGAAGDASQPSEMPEAAPVVDRLKATWLLSDQFTTDELDSITAAAEAWNTVTEGRVELTLAVGQVEGPASWTISRSKIEGTVVGRTYYINSEPGILIDAERYAGATCVGQVWAVAAHEFGHTLGITKHGTDGVMRNDTVNCDATFTKSDLELFNAANP